MLMQSESDSSWLLPCVCAHSVHMTGILILFWYHLDVPTAPQRVPRCAHYIYRSIQRVWWWCHQERDWHVNCRSATLQWSDPMMSNSGDFQSPPSCQSCIPHTYHYLCAILVSIHLANLRERSHLFHTISTHPTTHDLFPTIAQIESHRKVYSSSLTYFHTIGKA
jgi:hypothetical protein